MSAYDRDDAEFIILLSVKIGRQNDDKEDRGALGVQNPVAQ